MKKLITLCIALSFAAISFAQVNKGEWPESNYYGQTTIVTGIDEIEDFTVIDSDGNTLNLYENLEAGKTVILDLFFSTWSSCQAYASIMEDVYVKWGEGEEDVLMWGLSPYDNNNQITTFKAQYGLTNPCAGNEGYAPDAIQLVIEGQQFFGYPTYCVICPDKKLHFNVCFPPSLECFDPIIVNCMPSAIGDEVSDESLIEIFPNPASDYANLQLNFEGSVKVEIMNLLGSVVYTNQFQASGQSNTILYVGDLSDGMYLLSVQTDRQTFSRKLTVRK